MTHKSSSRNCANMDFNLLISKKKQYINIRSQFADPSATIMNDILDEVIDKIGEATCYGVIGEVTGTPGSIVYIDQNGALKTSSRLKFDDTDGSETMTTRNVRVTDIFTGGVFETGLESEGLSDFPTGTTIVWNEGKCVKSYKKEDEFVMGVTRNGHNQPIVLGAEPILVTGKVKEGDYLVTSNVPGHCKAVKRRFIFKKDLFGKVIAQALESSEGESNLIKAMIRKM